MARRLYFVVPPGINSFYYSAFYAYSYIDPSIWEAKIVNNPKIGGLNIVVDDMWNVIHNPRRAPIWWVDTPLYYLHIEKPKIPKYVKEIWVTSTWNYEQCKEFFNNCRIIPRLPHPIYLANTNIYGEREYDIAFVGSCWWRKFCRQFKDIATELGLKWWMTGSYNNINLLELVEKLKRTKYLWWITGSEGFGLPLLEAQLLGVIPICIDAHANRDYCFSMNLSGTFRVEPVKKYFKIDITGNHKIWEPDWNEVRRKIREIANSEFNIEYAKIVANSALKLVEYTVRVLNENLYRAYTLYF